MTFLSPLYLWGLLSIFPLAAIYLLKVKPSRQSTNAWFLWEQVFEEKQNSALFSKMRHLLSLLLMVLAICAIFFSLAQPRFGDSQQADLVIVIDNSASMHTRDGGSTRLEKAKADAHQLVRSLHGDQRALIASVSNELEFRTHLSRNAHQLHEAIDSISQSQSALSTTALQNLTSHLSVSKNDKTQVTLLTDACSTPALAEHDQLQTRSYFHATQNVGIINADIQATLHAPETARCMIQLGSAAQEPIELEVEISHAETGAIGKLTKVTVEPGVNAPEFYDIPTVQGSENGHWLVKILRDDALKTDNTAHLFLQPLRSIPVSTDAQDSYFYQRCLEAFSRTGGGLTFSPQAAESQLTLSHKNIPPGNADTILFAPRGASPFWENVGSEIEVGLAIKKDDKHPAVRHLDCNQLAFGGAVKLSAPANAKVLIESDDGTPLLYTMHSGQRTVTVVNLDPEVGDFYLSPWFPVIVYDLATFMSGSDQQLASSYSSGARFTPSMTTETRIVAPNGDQHTVGAGKALTLDQVGIYTLKNAQQTRSLAVSLHAETDTTQPENSLPNTSRTNILQASPSFWLIILALVILIAESLLYHRRKAG